MRRKNSNVHGIQIQRYGSFSRMGTADKLYQIVVVAIVVLVALFCLFPMIYVVLLSVTSEQEWIQRGNSMLVPFKPTIAGYIKVFKQSKIYTNALFISAMRTLIGTALSLVFTMYVGYVLSRREMPGVKVLFFMIMITVLFSGGTIPTYLTVKNLGDFHPRDGFAGIRRQVGLLIVQCEVEASLILFE